MKFTLGDIPVFEITSESSDEIYTYYKGRFDKQPIVKENWLVDLIEAQNNIFVHGRCIKIDNENLTAKFRTKDNMSGSLLGKSMSVIDGYWGERIMLVLDTTMKWEKSEVTKQEDHEHCHICMGKIGNGGERNTGWTGQGRFYWICFECFGEYFETKSIEFVNSLTL